MKGDAMPEEQRDWFQDPPPRRVGVLALLTRGTTVLLIRRTYGTPVYEWGLPGGSAAANELPRRALSRLLAEKLALRVTPGPLTAVDHTPEWAGHHHEGTTFIYSAPTTDDTEPIVDQASGYAEAVWTEHADIPHWAIDHELHRIQQCLHAARTGRVEELLLGIPQHTGCTTSGTG
ncbi:NUDIX domain-containing protein [Streptomyces sp. NPDC006739]|uniref:NUDIX domain-containing protein n=1 Tax=Streptomyces sp. NPDC006739 TaxID=3364763 RepID=UPI003686470F